MRVSKPLIEAVLLGYLKKVETVLKVGVSIDWEGAQLIYFFIVK